MPQINLTWEDRSLIEDGYYVYKDTSPIVEGALPAVYDTVAADTETYVDNIDMEDALSERLYYRVAAYKDSLQKLSNEISIGNPANPFYNESPTYIFKGGEDGFLNLLSIEDASLFTDTAGTTPVTDIGDTIALGLDQSGNGNDMVQATAAERPVYGQMPVSGVRNQLHNNMMTGAVVGFPGAIPTDWTNTGALAGIQREVTLVDNVNGRIRLKWSGTTASTNTVLIRPSDLTTIKAKAGQTWCWHYDIRVVSGSMDNIATTTTAIVERDSGGSAMGSTVGTIELGSSLMHVSQSRTLSHGDTVSATPQIVLAPDGIGLPIDIEIELSAMQFEMDTETALQQVITPYDVTEPGISSVNIAYMDTSDDNFSWTLPAGTYHLFIAGDLGCYFDTVEHTGGEFTVGPTSWTGGPAGAITTLIGQRHVIMPVIRDEAFTQFEREQLVAYVMARGCPGVWNAGSELVTNGNFAGGMTGWTDESTGTGTAAVSGGTAQLTGTDFANRGQLAQNISLDVGYYLAAAECLQPGGSGFLFRQEQLAAPFGSTFSIGMPSARVYKSIVQINAVMSHKTMFRAQGGKGALKEGDNMSLKQLTQSSTPI